MQAVGAAVRVAVQLPLDARAIASSAAGNGGNGPFVRGELDDALEPELALDVLDRLARLVRA